MLNKFKPKSEFSRHVLTLMTGTTIAQAIPIAISPILTRIYTPEDFGIFALYMSIATLLSVVATARYELAIMLPKKDEDAANIVVLSLLISVIVSAVSLLLLYLFNARITELLANPNIAIWLYFIPFSVLLTGIYQSFNYWNNRKKQYRLLATSRVVRSAATASSNLSMGFYGLGSSGLIIGGLIGQGVATSMLTHITYKEHQQQFKKIKKLKILALMKRYKKLPIFNLPNALIDGFRLLAITVLIAKFFTTATLGQFSLAWKMVQAPMSLIGSSLSQVFFQKVAAAQKYELHTIVKQFVFKAFIVSLPIFLMIYFFAVDIFTVIFGENWKLAGEVASALAPWLFLNFLTSPLSTIFIVLSRQESVLVFAIFYMIVPLSIILLYRNIDFIEMLEILSFSMSIMLVLFIGMLTYYTKKEQND